MAHFKHYLEVFRHHLNCFWPFQWKWKENNIFNKICLLFWTPLLQSYHNVRNFVVLLHFGNFTAFTTFWDFYCFLLFFKKFPKYFFSVFWVFFSKINLFYMAFQFWDTKFSKIIVIFAWLKACIFKLLWIDLS